MTRPVVLIGLDPGRYRNGHVSYVTAHALAASRAGFSPQIFCPGSEAGTEQTEFGTVHRVAVRTSHFLLAQVMTRPLAKAIASYLDTCESRTPFIIHGFGTWGAAAVDAAGEAAKRGIAAVPVANAYTVAAHEWRGLLRGLDASHGRREVFRHAAWYPWVRTVVTHYERRGFEQSRLVLVNYDSVAQLVRGAYGPRLEIRRAPYAAATAFDGAAPDADRVPEEIAALEPAAAPLIVSVSRHSPCKGVDVLLRALGQLKADGVAFRACLVGPGRLLEAHRMLSSRLGLEDQVAIPGEVEDVLDYLRWADVFALPSLEEGSSGSVSLLEALQMRVAVVASGCDGIPEDVTDGEDGLLVAPGDAFALKAALASVLDDAGLRARLAGRGRDLYERRFSAERFVAALAALYAELGASN